MHVRPTGPGTEVRPEPLNAATDTRTLCVDRSAGAQRGTVSRPWGRGASIADQAGSSAGDWRTLTYSHSRELAG